MLEKKNVIQHLEYIYNDIILRAENEFKNTNNNEIIKTITELKEEINELTNNKILEDASKNGVTSQNIEMYKTSKSKIDNISKNARKLNTLIQNENCSFLLKSLIEDIEKYIEMNLQNKMKNKIETYNSKNG